VTRLLQNGLYNFAFVILEDLQCVDVIGLNKRLLAEIVMVVVVVVVVVVSVIV